MRTGDRTSSVLITSHVTLEAVLTKRYRPFEAIGTDTKVSSVASNGQKTRDHLSKLWTSHEQLSVMLQSETNCVLFKRLRHQKSLIFTDATEYFH